MFKFLKEKIETWVKKLTPKEEIKDKKSIKPLVKKSSKKEISNKKKSKQPKIGNQIIKDIQKEEKLIKKQYEPEEIKIEKGFFGNLFNKKEEKQEHPNKGIFSFFKSEINNNQFEELFSDLELSLLQNNIAMQVVEEIKSKLKEAIVGKSLKEVNINSALRDSLESILINPPDLILKIKEKLKEKSPYIIIFIGINGSGKTTTIAKIAYKLKKQGFKVCLAAGDTFRAASIEQLEQHAKKIGVPIIKKDYGTDPASVGFEAILQAKKQKLDVVLMDTAGRMNTKDSLIKEMEKIVRVCQPDLKMFIGESITGNDATEQAKTFNDSINIDGIILSKADVDEKGGTAISVSKITQKPIFFLGTGQNYEDIEEFNKENIIKKLGIK